MARDLIGDYGNMTVVGEWLSVHALPFWRFQEINIKRYPRLAINAARAGEYTTLTGASAMAVWRGMLLLRIPTMFAALWWFNKAVMGHKEDELSPYHRQNPHLTLCRKATGEVRVFNNVGALGELMEWLGINTLIGLYPLYCNKQLTGKDLIREMGKDPANKMMQALSPHLKAIWELPTGMTTFPDVSNPRKRDRGSIAADYFGLSDEYQAVKGLLLQNGLRARPHYIERFLYGIVNPRRSAIHEMHSLRERFLRKEGREVEGNFTASKTRYMRYAAMFEDFESFKKARAVYLAEGGTYDKFKRSIAYIDPIARRLNDEDEQKFEHEFLTSLQRERLKVARDYAKEVELTLWQWWNEAAEDDAPEERNKLRGQIKYDNASTAYACSGKEFDANARRRLRMLEDRGLSRGEMLQALDDYWTRRGWRLGSDAHIDARDRLKKRLGR
jgi:hypothetical protein